MPARPFTAFVVSQQPDGAFSREIQRRDVSDLPAGELLVRVSYSSLNYKDALAATGRRGVARGYPLTPGIDAAGTVEEGTAGGFAPGDRVIVTGHELGTGVPGGFGRYIRVPAAWALGLPPGLSLKESMAIGTAGFTAAYAVRTLRDSGVEPARGPVLVTGATGGLGCIAVAVLAGLGYAVTAGTGKPDRRDFLTSLGARQVLGRDDLKDSSGKALLKENWAGVIDAVGGEALAAAIKSTAYGGAVAACGNAASPDLSLTVFPFILRGVRLLGIESSRCPAALRRELWSLLAGPWKPSGLDSITRECTLAGLGEKIDQMLRGGITGRVVVNLDES